MELSIGQQSLEAGVLQLVFLQALGLCCLNAAVELMPAVVGRCRHLQGSAEIGNVLALVEELLSSAQHSADLLGVIALAFHVASPGQVWPVGKLS